MERIRKGDIDPTRRRERCKGPLEKEIERLQDD